MCKINILYIYWKQYKVVVKCISELRQVQTLADRLVSYIVILTSVWKHIPWFGDRGLMSLFIPVNFLLSDVHLYSKNSMTMESSKWPWTLIVLSQLNTP